MPVDGIEHGPARGCCELIASLEQAQALAVVACSPVPNGRFADDDCANAGGLNRFGVGARRMISRDSIAEGFGGLFANCLTASLAEAFLRYRPNARINAFA